MNQLVKAGSATLRRNVFNARIVDELEGSHYKTFVVEKDHGGPDSVAYELEGDNYKTFVIDDQRGADHPSQLTRTFGRGHLYAWPPLRVAIVLGEGAADL